MSQVEIQREMSKAWEQDRDWAAKRGGLDDAYELGFIAAWRAAKAEPLGWQQIETAPRDKYLVLYCADGFFTPEQVIEIGTWANWKDTATHWMPLPAPPESRTHE